MIAEDDAGRAEGEEDEATREDDDPGAPRRPISSAVASRGVVLCL